MEQPVVSAKTGIYAILGDPIAHSLSPVIMNGMFRRLGMDKVFLALRANRESIGRIFPVLRELGFLGYVLTMPVKEDVTPFLDELRAEAELIGAVNCIANDGGRLIGHNTDSVGFWTAVLEKTGNKAPKAVFILGAGGFAKAAAAQAAIRGARRIWSANPADGYDAGFRRFAETLVERFPGLAVEHLAWTPESWREALAQADLIVNATPNGLGGKGDLHSVFPFGKERGDAVFFDAIYDPLETAFLAAAKERGHITVDGLDLLSHQGVCSFRIWTGGEADAGTMRKSALEFLGIA